MSLVDIGDVSQLVRETKPMTREQFWKFLDLLERPWRTIALVSIAHGLRIGEATAIKWFDFDWEANPVTLRIERDWVRGFEYPCKTRESRKIFKLHPYLEEEFKAWMAQASYRNPKDWVFASLRPELEGRKPYHVVTVWRHYEKAARQVGLKRWNTHIMRHSHASWLTDYLKVHQVVLQRSMRHKKAATTERYLHEVLSGPVDEAQYQLTEIAFEQERPKVISSDFKPD
jgi:integrase